MNEAKHTPGPWAVWEAEHEGDLVIEPLTGDNICLLSGGLSLGAKARFKDYKANAKLIARAPELLEFIKGLLAGGELNSRLNKIAKDLIQKATS